MLHGVARIIPPCAAPVRAELGVRTIFNMLGPLCNPARVERQTIGVFSRDWLEPLACALSELGAKRVLAAAWKRRPRRSDDDGANACRRAGRRRDPRFDIAPEDAGLPRATAQALVGGDPAHNASALRAVLNGAKNAYRDIAVLNAGVALVVAERAADIREGAALAARALNSGAAREKLNALIHCSNRDA